MQRNWRLRPYKSRDEDKIVPLLQKVFHNWPHFDLRCEPIEHWRWKFCNNPLDLTLISLCEIDDRIIGCTHRVPKKVKIGENTYLCVTGADAAVHPHFRKMGIFDSLHPLAADLEENAGVKLFYGISSNPVVVNYHSNWLQTFPHCLIELVRIKNINLHLQMKNIKRAGFYRYAFHFAKVIHRMRRSKTPANDEHYPHPFHISEISSFDNRVTQFWHAIRDNYSFSIERTREYLNWRYCNPKGGDYHIKIAESDGGIVGFIILRVNKYLKDYPEGYIVDLLTIPNRLDVAQTLISQALDFFKAHDTNAVKCRLVKNSIYQKLLHQHGFLDSHVKTHMFFRPHPTLGEDLKILQRASPSNLHFTYGDNDEI